MHHEKFQTNAKERETNTVGPDMRVTEISSYQDILIFVSSFFVADKVTGIELVNNII